MKSLLYFCKLDNSKELGKAGWKVELKMLRAWLVEEKFAVVELTLKTDGVGQDCLSSNKAVKVDKRWIMKLNSVKRRLVGGVERRHNENLVNEIWINLV